MQNLSSKIKNDITNRSYKFSLKIINFIEKVPYSKSNKIIINQVLRSATSIGANLVEGKAASSRLEFKKFFEIALKSSNETKYWLCLIRDSQINSIEDKKDLRELLNECIEISNILGKSVISLKKR